MKNFCYSGNAINFLQKGITLSLLILLNLAAYSNPMGENRERKADNNFLSGKSLFTSFDHYLKNNLPEEASNAARPAECTYHMRRNSGRVPAGASSGNEFGFTVRGNNCSWTPVSNASWITNVAKPNMANLDDSWDVTYSCAANPTTSERSGTITMVGYTYTVTQAGAVCSVSLPSATGNVPATTGTGSFSVAANGNECTWTATVATEATWLSIPAGQTLSGAKNLNYSYETNPNTTPRTGTITVAGYTYTVTQVGAGASSCSYTLAPTEARIGSSASTAETKGSFSVTVQGTDCSATSATPATTDNWITGLATVPRDARNGLWTVTYSYLSNTSATERRGSITVGGKTHTVIQAGAGAASCSYTLSPTEVRIGSSVSTAETKGSFSVTVQGTDCSVTSATPGTTDNWITGLATVPRDARNGLWTVTYSYLSNTSATERRGRITVGGKTHTVIQAGAGAASCSYTLSPTEVRIGSSASTAETKGSFSVTVQGTDCSVTSATPGTTDNWITGLATVPRDARNGLWTVTYSYLSNTSATERRGSITVGGKTHTVIQAGAGAACSYTLAPTEVRIGSSASTAETKGSFSVTVQGTNCSATSATPGTTDNWITGLATVPRDARNGLWTVTYSYLSNTSATERRGSITVGGKTHTVIQAGAGAACSYTLAPTEARIGSSASTVETKGSFSVTVQGTDCSATSATPGTTDNWITGLATVPRDARNGLWTVTYSYLSNTSATERRGSITVGGKTHTVIQAGAGAASCSYTLAPTEARIGSSASTAETKGSFSVTVQGTDCSATSATPTTTDNWITGLATVPRDARNGLWTVTYSYLSNTSATERRGRITVGGKTHTVIQAGAGAACSYTLAPTEARIGSSASTAETKGSFSVTVQGTNCSATSATPGTTDNWITGLATVPRDARNGLWTVTYSYLSNTSATERRGSITVGGKTHTVIQAGAGASSCSYTLSPTEVRIGSSASTAETKGSFSVTVQGTDCSWTPASPNIWITNVTKAATANADGSWTVTYSYMANTNTAERRGTITVADKTHTVIQAGGATCSISLSKNTGSVPAEEGTDAFLVLSNGDACEWTAIVAQDAGWLSIDEGQIMIGTNDLYYSYETNPNTTPRTGTITVAGYTYTVTQVGAGASSCSYTLAPTEARIGSAAATAETKGSFSVTVEGSDCSLTSSTPATTDNWITRIATVPVDAKNGLWTVTYFYLANTSPTERRGSITVGDKTHTVIQSGTGTSSCSYTLAPTEARIGSSSATAETKGSFSVTVEGSACSLTSSTPATTDNWITRIATVPVDAKNGLWTVTYFYLANTSSTERRGSITVGDKTHTVIQSGTGSSCSYTLAPTEARIGSAASTEETKGSFSVTVQGDCSSTPVTTDNWITHIQTVPPDANGLWTVTYSYLANTTNAERRGTIIVADQIFTVTQSGIVTGIEPISSMELFPNPAKDFVTVDLSTDKTKYVWLKIVNQAGQILYKMDSPPAQVLQIPLNGFGSGMYFILLQGEEKALVKKLIVR